LLGIDFKSTDNKFYQWCAECQIGEATAFWESVEGFGGGFWYRPSDGETRKDFLSSQDIVSKDMVPGGDFSELFLARFDKELLHLRMKMRDDAVKKSQAAQMQAEAKKKAHVEQQHYTPEEAAVLCRREEIAAAAEKRSSQAQQGRGATPPAKGNPSKWSVFLSNFFTRSSLDDIGTPEEFEKKIDDLIEEAQQNVDHSPSLYTSGPVKAVPKKPIRSGGTGAYVDLPGDTAEVIKKKGPETRKEIQKEISEKKKVELLKKKRNMPAVVEMV
jgi:tRNA A37 N6-isopentenylltransferase MiaA